MDLLQDAAQAIDDGELIIYPTETVYGLGADALDSGAIERVFGAKDRPRTNPIAMAVPSVEVALDYVEPDDDTIEFMESFLPGPVTVICQKGPDIPSELTGGRDRVGIRIPDYDLTQRLLSMTPPLTATSANVSGMEPIRDVDDLDETIHRAVSVIIDDGETPGGASTVVDVDAGRIHRYGRKSTEVQAWLDNH